jgi:hypothetical protein
MRIRNRRLPSLRPRELLIRLWLGGGTGGMALLFGLVFGGVAGGMVLLLWWFGGSIQGGTCELKTSVEVSWGQR